MDEIPFAYGVMKFDVSSTFKMFLYYFFKNSDNFAIGVDVIEYQWYYFTVNL